jgi:protein-arginine kinase activator protein McsA
MKDELKILCPFCNAVWSAEMEDEYEKGGSSCETCGPYDHVAWTVTIYCSNCKKVVYVKESDYFEAY